MGLISQAVARAPRWVLKKLTATYVTLHLADIGKAIKIGSEDEVRELLLSMVRSLPSSFISFIYLRNTLVDRIKRHQCPNLRRWDCDVLGPATAVHEGTS